MRTVQINRTKLLFIACFFGGSFTLAAQDSTGTPEPTVKLRYYSVNNTVQYLLTESVLQEGKRSKPFATQPVEVYLDSSIASNLIVNAVTNEKGQAKLVIPPSLKDQWNKSSKHSFLAALKDKTGEAVATSTLEITRCRIELDTVTTDGVRNIHVKVMYLDNGEWLPANEVELKIGISRSGSILPAGDEPTYTTDSSGTVSVEYKRDSLPGDIKGDLRLAAKIEDHELFGNLLVEKVVPWGVITKPETGFFDQRTLWSTRFRTPPWLLFMAYSIVIAVWGTLLYLAWELYRIKKVAGSK